MPRKRYVSTSGVSEIAVRHATEGTYQRAVLHMTGLNFVEGTEYEVSTVADVIVASTENEDELFTWVRGMYFVYSTSAHMSFEWALIKIDSADADPDLNSGTIFERLHKEKRVFARGMILNPDPDVGGPVKPFKFEVHQVKLLYGEELRLLLRPIGVSGAADGQVVGLLEWRQQGV